ncbi:MAG: ABC transporter substrate-binding protein [Actinomycetota bacterium]|nr:ABC transporter substrate-binding protein [Actinomycetota bacterium]
MRRTPQLLAALTLGLALVACGGDDDDAESASTTDSAASAESTTTTAAEDTAETDDTSDAESDADADADAGAAGPVTVELCGREWTYAEPPQRIVTTDTPMLDLALMMGLGDRVVGYFGSVDNLDPAVQDEAAGLERLGDNWPYPTLEAILAGEPDLVMSYGYNAEAGFTAERLQEEGIGNFTISEGCEDFTGTSTIDSYYEDVRTFAEIVAAPDAADELIAGWQDRVDAVVDGVPEGEPVRVLNTGSGDPAAPFVSGNRAVAHDLIETAGGADVFGDTDEVYLSPTWEEVVARDPQLIVESSGFGQEGLDAVIAHLESNPALSSMAAVTRGNFVSMRYEEGVPGPQMFTGLEILATAVADAAG